MTDARMTAAPAWPDPERPGYPLHPERDGWHWLIGRTSVAPRFWHARQQLWQGDEWVWPHHMAERHTYGAPCLTPAQVEQRVAAAVAAEREAADDMADALHKIVQWAEAYPEDIFPPVDIPAARARLGDDALFSRLHAEWARHLCKGIGGIAAAAIRARGGSDG